MRRRVPFKDCQSDECLNHSLLIDALIVAGVKGISRRNTHNVLKSFCPMMGKESNTDERQKAQVDNCLKNKCSDYRHKCDCIFRNCKLCGSVGFQKSIQLWNEGTDWNKLLLGINGNMFIKMIQSLRKMKGNILIKLGTQVLWNNCLHYL